MNETIFDTHALVWLFNNSSSLSLESRRTASEALAENSLAVSAFTFWEIAMLHRKNRPIIPRTASEFRIETQKAGILEIPVTTEIAILSQELDDSFPADPADRIIAATALAQQAVLVTADAAILGWPGELRRHDARR